MPSTKVLAIIVSVALFTPSRYSLFLTMSIFFLAAPYFLLWIFRGSSSSIGSAPNYRYRSLIILYFLMILASIVVNGRILVYQDYMEMVSVIKFAGTFYLSYSIARDPKGFYRLTRIFVVIVSIYLLLNAGQIFDYYFGGPFGGFYELYAVDSQKQVTEILREREEANRFTGLSGNPNSNGAILLVMLLAVVYATGESTFGKVLALTFVILILFSQSRTALIALMAIAAYMLIQARWTFFRFLRLAVPALILLIAAFIAVEALNLTFVTSIFNQNILQNESLSVRVLNWSTLIQMIEESPVFGHAPRQEFFAQEKINADSEYILTAWRYGILGLALEVLLILYPYLVACRKPQKPKKFRSTIIALTLITVVIGITNVTLSDYRYSVIYAFTLGVVFGRPFRDYPYKVTDKNIDQRPVVGC